MNRFCTLLLATGFAVAPLAHAEHGRYGDFVEDDRYDTYEQPYDYDGRYEDRYQSTRHGRQYDRGYRSDWVLHDDVHDALERALGVEARGIRVDVRRGRVVLSGNVRDARARAIAHEVAHEVPGVRAVMMGRLYARYWR